VKIDRALEVLNLERLPTVKDEVEAAYKMLAKKLHPDVGGSEEAFQELTAAYEVALKAWKLVFNAAQTNSKEEAIQRRRAAMREAMLKRRAQEDYQRNVQATKGIYAILSVLVLIVLFFALKPLVNKFMVERNPIEQMGTVTYSDRTDTFIVTWNWDGSDYEKTFKGRFVDAKWLVTSSGMPVLIGNQYIVRFNAQTPSFAILRDEYISPETAEVFFNVVRHPLAAHLKISVEDPAVVCLYWSILDRFGVDGLAHVLFQTTPFRKNWYHNEGTFQGLINSEEYKKMYTSCMVNP